LRQKLSFSLPLLQEEQRLQIASFQSFLHPPTMKTREKVLELYSL
jgi:hypothetical protein